MERNDIPASRDERTQLETLLDHARATVVWKCEGISEQLAHVTPLPTSPLVSIASIVNHLRWDENVWFSVRLHGEPDLAPSSEEDPDGEFRVAAQMTMPQLVADYEAECAKSRAAIAGLPLETPLKYTRDNGFQPDVRWTILHMLDETARHNGHLDLLREMADGAKGY
jgi:uncharacterized protein DUF664